MSGPESAGRTGDLLGGTDVSWIVGLVGPAVLYWLPARRAQGGQPSSAATVTSAGTDSSVDSRMESRANRSAIR
ncbi:hypothetical protein YW5DRAFT_01339 [Streptomyces sp. Ncost-T6T-1]|nr:hypothetical protein YW5DRAFT_01339 [Streptomyces sp. Ncost-T6T-1]